MLFLFAVMQNQSFPNSFYLQDYSTDAPPSVQEGRGDVGGYGIVSVGIQQ